MFAYVKQGLAAFVMAIIFVVTVSTVQAQEKKTVAPSRVPAPQFTLPKSTEKCVHDPDFAKTGKCVRDTKFMRRNHMDLLTHKRDLTMYKGLRTKAAGLQNCINCHVTKDDKGSPIKVSNPKHFCAACHEFVAVKLDCFECHRSTPEKTTGTAQIPNIPAHSRLLVNNAALKNSDEAKNLGKFLQGVSK